MTQASERWMQHLESENEKLAAAAKVPGNGKPLATGAENDAGKDAAAAGNPKAELNRIASEFQKAGMSRMQ